MFVIQHSRSIILMVLISIAFFIPVCVAQSNAPVASSPRINPATRGRCALRMSQSPTVFNLQLGMSLGEVAERLPTFRQLGGFAAGKTDELDIRDSAGDQALLARRDRLDGTEFIVVKGSHLKRKAAAADLSPMGLRDMTLFFLDRRLVLISLSDWVSPRWGNTDEFVKEVSRVYRFSSGWWQRGAVKPAPSDAPLGYRDFFSPVIGFECEGFQVEARCVGSPAPPGLCSLSIHDTEAKQAMDKRRQTGERKLRQK